MIRSPTTLGLRTLDIMSCWHGDYIVHTKFQVLGCSLLQVNPCNLNHLEHGSLDIPLHMGSQVLSHRYYMDDYMATLF